MADLEMGWCARSVIMLVRRAAKYLRCYGRHERPQMIRSRVVTDEQEDETSVAGAACRLGVVAGPFAPLHTVS